ncbi:MAG TPA: hypothetical protein VGK35_13920 [Actinotalea sp.]|jgi:hypothetical protein
MPGRTRRPRLRDRRLVRIVSLTALLALLLSGAVESAQAATGQPIGNVDVVRAVTGGVQVKGWAWDGDSTSSVTVVVTVGSTTKQTTASTYRPDVARAYPAAGSYRGFDTTVAVANGTYKVCVVAKNLGAGTDKAFTCSTVTVGTVTSTALAPAPATGVGGSTNTGVPAGTALKVWNGDLTITTPGTVIDGYDVRGYVRVKAGGVTIKNSIIRGRSGLTSYMSLIQADDAAAGLTVQDSELVAAYPTPYVDGIVGKGFTLRRVDIHGVVDTVKITGDNVLVDTSWLHGNLYYLNDPNYGGTPTHDDNVQVQRGNNITVRNSTLQNAHNAGVMITQDAGAVSNFVFTGNRAENGSCTMNVAEKSYGPVSGLRITSNVYGLNSQISRCAILMRDTSKAVATVTGNLFTDGSIVTVSRG